MLHLATTVFRVAKKKWISCKSDRAGKISAILQYFNKFSEYVSSELFIPRFIDVAVVATQGIVIYSWIRLRFFIFYLKKKTHALVSDWRMLSADAQSPGIGNAFRRRKKWYWNISSYHLVVVCLHISSKLLILSYGAE